jgi:mRNA interferase RelE/StbE
MKGHPEYFRVRIGDYRLGLKRINGGARIMRFLSRGDIYPKFP